MMFILKPKPDTALPVMLLMFFPFTMQATAQGLDSEPAMRMRLIIAEMLPGIYDNMNQAYFDRRRNLDKPQQHERRHLTIERLESATPDRHSYRILEYKAGADRELLRQAIWQLTPDPARPEQVRMRIYPVSNNRPVRDVPASADGGWLPEDCDILWERRAGQFYGKPHDTCDKAIGVHMLSEDGLWFHQMHKNSRGEIVPTHPGNTPYELERARIFHCYADVPGVGGGRAVPFRRYGPYLLHDKGGRTSFIIADKDKRKIAIRLNNVTWRINNEKNLYTRNSLVLYIEQTVNNETQQQYSFTEPSATRLGLNVGAVLVNCAITPRSEARPRL